MSNSSEEVQIAVQRILRAAGTLVDVYENPESRKMAIGLLRHELKAHEAAVTAERAAREPKHLR